LNCVKSHVDLPDLRPKTTKTETNCIKSHRYADLICIFDQTGHIFYIQKNLLFYNSTRVSMVNKDFAYN